MSDGYQIGGVNSMGPADINDIVAQLEAIPDPNLRRGVATMLGQNMAASGQTANAARMADVANRVATHRGVGQVSFSSDGAAVGQTVQTAPPHANTVQQGAGYATTPLRNLKNMQIRVEGSWRSAEETEGILRKGLTKHPDLTRKVMANNGIVEKDGEFHVVTTAETAAFNSAVPGQAGNAIGESAFGILNKPWVWPLMALPGVGGIIGMAVGAKALKSVMGGGGLGGGGLAMAAAGLTGGGQLGNIGSAGFWGTGATAAQFLGFPGMALSMKKIMMSHAEDFKDQSLIGMINNPNIPIEDLLFYFMAAMADKYEDKLRSKMEEVAVAEQKERQRENAKAKGELLGGIASAFGPAGAVVGKGIEMFINEKQRIHDSLDGGVKSSTLLMSEVQVLMQKWKQLNELLSNLLKSLHDMAMTPIRNLR